MLFIAVQLQFIQATRSAGSTHWTPCFLGKPLQPQDDADFQEALGLGQDQEEDFVDGAAEDEEAAGIGVEGDQDMGQQVDYDFDHCKS
jgi:hypothetical protein